MSKWIPSWRYVPINYGQEIGAFENITQQAVFTNNLSGEAVRLRLCNLYNPDPMTVEHMTLTLRDRESGRITAALPVTLNGSETLVIPPFTELYSDELPCAVSYREDFIVSAYFGARTPFSCACTTNTGFGWQSAHLTGNYHETDALGFTVLSQIAPGLAADPNPCQFAVGLSEIAVLTGDEVQLMGLFGDSITHMSYVFDSLLALLYEALPGRISLINGGIAGNRIAKDFPKLPDFPGGGSQFGPAGKTRFERDMYNGACPDIVFVMEGVNDCSHTILFEGPPIPTPEDIYAALRDVTAQAHAHGSKVYITTIPPFGAFGEWWREEAEALRQGYNALIRADTSADDRIDLDALLRDPDAPARMQAGMHLGDGVHPSWNGGRKMARAIFERWFRE